MPVGNNRRIKSVDSRKNIRSSEGSRRRTFLKTVGSGGIGMVLAGCLGIGANNDPSSDGQEEDVTVQYWDASAQSNAAKEMNRELIKEFEADTGTTVRTNYDTVDNYTGQKWISSFQRGDYPNITTGFSHGDGKFIKGGWIKPFNEYKEQFDQETLNSINWILPVVKDASRMWDGIMAVPYGVVPKNPLIARTDHFKKAGLDPEEDFPPKSYEQLIQIAKTLQEDGPGKYGFQMWGTASDWLEIAHPWAVSLGGEKGRFLNNSTDDTNIDNDTWVQCIKNWSKVMTKYDLTSGGTPNANDETAPPLMRKGDVSMTQAAPATHPDFMDQAGEMMKDGTIQWGPMWEKPSGSPGVFALYTIMITEPPKDSDSKNWDSKQQAAIKLAQKFLSKEFQTKLLPKYGYLPVRDDVRDSAQSKMKSEDSHHFTESLFTMAQDIDIAWSFDPKQRPAMTSPATAMQKVLQGKITPEKGCQQAAKTFQNTI